MCEVTPTEARLIVLMHEASDEVLSIVIDLLHAPPDTPALDIIEAVLGGRYCHQCDPPGFKQYGVVVPTDKPLPTFEDMKGIYADNPCPTCGGSGESWEERSDVNGRFNVKPCPECRGKHFIPGKGRGM